MKKIVQTAGRNALNEFLPEFAHFNDDVLFGENWHIYHAKSGGGQILVCVAGRGFYQEEGKEAVEMKPGDCINIPAEVKHWHGAAPDEWFSHLAIEVPGVDCSNEWCEAVSEKEYARLK